MRCTKKWVTQKWLASWALNRFILLGLTLLFGQLSFAQIELEFSHQRGFFDIPFSLELTSDEPNATIYYTTDFSRPSQTNGAIYNSPIQIDETSTIRAVAYENGDLSENLTHTYIFVEDVIDEDYMYDYIKNGPTYGPLLTTALKSLPSISITSNALAPGVIIEDDEEISAELIFPNGKEGFMVLCGLETWGGSPTNPKKSYRLEFKSKYGPSKLEYDLFGPDDYENHEYKIEPVEEFDKLLLRAGSQDGLNGEFGRELRAQYIRNRVIMDASIELGYHAPHGRFVHVYFNNEYLGQYHLMERPDESFFESYFGGEKEDYEVRRGDTDYWEGDGTFYESIDDQMDFSSASALANTAQYIDLKSASNYLVMMSFLSGHDWSSNQNSLCGGHTTPGVTPYKFILWDLDLSQGNGGWWYPTLSGDVNYFKSLFTEQGPVPSPLSGSIMDETEFRIMLGDAMQCACFEDGILEKNNYKSQYAKRAAQIDTSIIAEAARWGNFDFSHPFHIGEPLWEPLDWENEVNRVQNNYLEYRTDTLINQFKTWGFYPSVGAVSFNQNGGMVNSGFTLELTGALNSHTIYYTIDGIDPRNVGGGFNGIVYNGPVMLPDGVIDVNARAWNGLEWSAMCPKRFYVGQAYNNLVINEIHYNPADSITPNMEVIDGKEFEFVELKNGGTTDIFLHDCRFVEGIHFDFPDGALVPANGYIIIGEDETNFNAKYGFNADYIYEGKLDNGGELLVLTGPDGAVLDQVEYDDKLPWDPIADDGLYSLGRIDDSRPSSSPNNWSHQMPYHTPKAQNVFSPDAIRAYDHLVINELYYDPPDSSLTGGGVIDGVKFEFIELKNTGPDRIYLTDLTFSAGVEYTFQLDDYMEGYSYLSLASDTALFRTRYGKMAHGQYVGELDDATDMLVIKDFFQHTVDSLNYTNQNPWPALGLQKRGIGLINEELDNALGSNWKIQTVHQTINKTNLFECLASFVQTNQAALDSRLLKVEQDISSNGFIPSFEAVEFNAGVSIDLMPSFEVKMGAQFTAKIAGCN